MAAGRDTCELLCLDLPKAEAARDRVLARIQSVPIPIDGLNSAPGYTPKLLASCCSNGPHNIGRYDARP